MLSLSIPPAGPATATGFSWPRSLLLVLAKYNCAVCHGSGLRLDHAAVAPCACVLRAIFRSCYARFELCTGPERYLRRAAFERGRGHRSPGRKDEEYIADFCLVAKRTLTPAEYRLFHFHFLCMGRSGSQRENYFADVYRLEEKLGRTYAELRPYPLYPLSDYFHGASRAA